MHAELRGECIYLAESDIHFPHLTVAQTLAVASKATSTQRVAADPNKNAYARDVLNATVAAIGLSRVLDTKIGSAFVPGVSGGERKRASIAEILIAGSRFQCWDNSTGGLDSANALNFVQALRSTTRATGSVAIASLYQASQDMYKVSISADRASHHRRMPLS